MAGRPPSSSSRATDGQELLEQAVRVLDADVVGLELELVRSTSRSRSGARRQRGRPRGARGDARGRLRHQGGDDHAGGRDDVGSPNRILREEVDGKVIVRTGRGSRASSGRVGRLSPDLRRAHGVDDATAPNSGARARATTRSPILTQKITRATCRAVSEYSSAPPTDRREGLRRPEVDGLAGLRGHAQGGDGRGGLAASVVEYQPVLIDALYAG
jgi:hypothetical protein